MAGLVADLVGGASCEWRGGARQSERGRSALRGSVCPSVLGAAFGRLRAGVIRSGSSDLVTDDTNVASAHTCIG